MNRPATAPAPRARLTTALDWLVTAGLAGTLSWTTLRLGGFLAETMVVSVWMLAATAVLAGLRQLWQPAPLAWVSWLPVPFLLYALASVLWRAPAPWLAWREWLLWFQMWIVFVLALHTSRTRAQTWTLAGTVVALALTGVAMAAYQRFVDPKWMMLGRTQAEQFFTRSAGMFGIPNSLAGLLELVVPASSVWLVARAASPAAKIFCGWLVAVCVFALILTGSRGGWLAVAVALTLWPLATGQSWRRAALGAGAAVAVFIGVVAALYIASVPARERIEPFLRGEFEHSRPLIWRAGWQLWQDAPWLGTGAASYNVHFDKYRPAGFLHEPKWTHNDYLNTLSDYGAIGFGLWAGAGAAILGLGWRRWRRARSEPQKNGKGLESWRWPFGLWLGLVAYAVHLTVDFHTKIPALAFLGALTTGLMLRDQRRAEIQPATGMARAPGVVLGMVMLALVVGRADGLYRAEEARFDWRRKIDKLARGEGELAEVVPRALESFRRAVQLDPHNGQAWADLAYATVLSWHVTQSDVVGLGEQAEVAARRALQESEALAEFWVRLGVALDMQARQKEGRVAFQRALTLAPRNAEWHFYYAYHLSALPEFQDEARQVIATCLALDPTNPEAEALRARLTDSRSAKPHEAL
ncbi:MAG: O-antigen ligase family protein [Candidatus Didemnitutus sp.]|nr:O-antigen ligase family protein [Candidatus Didemnitutus sp.]